ncbi:MAG TPA: hypothetical protein VKV73_10720 [Chloroflexota bacterium]|nr:hypothetical protein [Chloroflexota bacterium]
MRDLGVGPGQHYPEELDDVDRLFARLDRAPVPEALTARVLASTVARTNATRMVLAWPWMMAALAALGLLCLAGYQLGASLAATDGLELVGALFDDLGLFTTAPGDVVAALGEVIPWSLVALAVVGAGLLVLAAGHVVSRTPAPQQSRQIA